MDENRRFTENESLFLKGIHMSLCSACGVQLILSIQTSFKWLTRVLRELSTIITKISCSVGVLHENRRFFRNKSLFLKGTNMFLSSACRVHRFLSIQTSFEAITRVFKELSTNIPKISCSVGELQETGRLFENKSIFLTETHMYLCSDVEYNEFYYRLRLVLKE